MKTKVFILTALAVLFTTAGFATKFPTMSVVSVDSEKAMVTFEPGAAKSFELKITDQQGQVLYYKKSESTSTDYKKVFDFSELKSGNFNLSINYDNCSISRNLVKENDQLTIGSELRLYEPWYRIEGDKLLVTHLNPSLKNVYMNIYENGQYVTRKKLGNEMAINKCIDISKLEGGEYQFILTDWYNEHPLIVKK